MSKLFEIFVGLGGKKFTQIHTKHLTVTIDAFTIHNSLWLGKRAKLPDKKDLTLVIWSKRSPSDRSADNALVINTTKDSQKVDKGDVLQSQI